MAGRTIAIGDIHGCPEAFNSIIGTIAPGPTDTVITLGDYIDRGPGSREVLDRPSLVPVSVGTFPCSAA